MLYTNDAGFYRWFDFLPAGLPPTKGWIWYALRSWASLNRSETLSGPMQDNFTAELRAALYVINTATVPTWMTSDCEGVVKGISAISEGKHPDTKINADIWAAFRAGIETAPAGFFRITWVKAHAVDGPEIYQNNFEDTLPEQFRGMLSYNELKWNQYVDALAKDGAS